MTIKNMIIEATGGSLAILLDTDDLSKFFGTEQAVNINSMQVSPVTLGTAVDILMIADKEVSPDEALGDKTTFPFAELNLSITLIDGATAGFIAQGDKDLVIFRFTTADVSPQAKFPSVYPITNHLIIGWSADVDFIIEFDYTELDIPWDFREEIIDLLAGKTMVEDPNLSNVDGKRQLNRAPLQIAED